MGCFPRPNGFIRVGQTAFIIRPVWKTSPTILIHLIGSINILREFLIIHDHESLNSGENKNLFIQET
jgi:hypothetical protein